MSSDISVCHMKAGQWPEHQHSCYKATNDVAVLPLQRVTDDGWSPEATRKNPSQIWFKNVRYLMKLSLCQLCYSQRYNCSEECFFLKIQSNTTPVQENFKFKTTDWSTYRSNAQGEKEDKLCTTNIWCVIAVAHKYACQNWRVWNKPETATPMQGRNSISYVMTW